MGFFEHAEIAFRRPEVSFRTPVILDYRIITEADLQIQEEVG